MLQLGLALTRHCNLRCPHCIRDDVSAVRSLDLGLIERVLDEARELFGALAVSLTGGEPLLHPDLRGIVGALRDRALPWRIVSNGWHVPRLLETLAEHPPEVVVLSLSGADAAVHDEERGRGSFARVLLAAGALRTIGVPAVLSMVVDRRDRHQLDAAVLLARDLGVGSIDFILPQPVPGSAARDSDLPPAEWGAIREEVRSLARAFAGEVAVSLAYGAPAAAGERETVCDTKRMRRIYVDPDGRLSLCCQLSDFGENREDVVADLHRTTLAEAMQHYRVRMARLRERTAPAGRAVLDAFPCMRCAGVTGKLDWLAGHPGSPWHGPAAAFAAGTGAATVRLPVLTR